VNKPRIYFAGRIRKNDQWRPGCEDGRSVLSDDDSFLEDGFPLLDFESFVNTGPHFISCDHGCAHGTSMHGVGAYSDQYSRSNGCVECWGIDSTHDRVRSICLKAIDNSDVVFAWLEPDAYGTVAEIGYAYAKGKRIFVAGPGAHSTSDLWFVAGMSSVVLFGDTPKVAIEAMHAHLFPEKSLCAVCESPIEKLLFQEFNKLAPFKKDVKGVVSRLGTLEIRPQFEVGRYRLDFAVQSDCRSSVIAVEVDGHDFHERTKEQATRDKSRDRELVARGWQVLRFTGSEVFRDAQKCMSEILALAQSRIGSCE
jgi:very-short-patch-repair endonuclease